MTTLDGTHCTLIWWVGFRLCTFGVMYDHTFSNFRFTTSDIRPHTKLAVSLVIAYGHFNIPQGFVWYVWGNKLTSSDYVNRVMYGLCVP